MNILPISSAPKDRYILLFGDVDYSTVSFQLAKSGCSAPFRCEVGRWNDDKSYWDNYSNDWGESPVYWSEIPAIPEKVRQNPVIWGKGWYAIPDDEDGVVWYFTPIDFYDKHGHIPDGFEYLSDKDAEAMEELGEWYHLPPGFRECIENGARYIGSGDPKQILIDAGFVIGEVKW